MPDVDELAGCVRKRPEGVCYDDQAILSAFSVVFVAVVVGIHYLPFPVAPFALILLVAETLVAFALKDHKVPGLIAGERYIADAIRVD